MERILQYFPDLTDHQISQFEALMPLYQEWNSMINVISRKDIDQLYLRHVLHSLSIAKLIQFLPESSILDLGTGGGFPGIPLAILFPETKFTLIDGTAKKIRVVNEVAKAIKLTNVIGHQKRAEEWKGEKFDFVVTRAVAQLSMLWPWCEKIISDRQRHIMPNGIWALKGGNVEKEIKDLGKGMYAEATPITDFYEEPFFKEKYVVYVQY